MPGFRINLRIGWTAALTTALMSVGWGYSAAQGATKEEALLIADDAENLWLHSRSATSRQISYTMDLVYPERAIGEPQWKRLRETGWSRCRSVDPGQEAANADWVDFEDATVTPMRTVHQRLTYWSRGDQMIMISLHYHSAVQSRSGKSRPDNTKQRIDLVFDDDHGREMAKWLELDCSK